MKPTELATYDSLPIDDDPLQIDKIKLPAKAKKKFTSQFKNAAAFAKFGARVLHLKSQTLAALGKAAEKSGIHAIGHGKVIVASEHAEVSLQHVEDLIEGLLAAEHPDHRLILEMLQMKRVFNDQLLRTAQAHFDADKYAEGQSNGKTMTLPPPGTTVMIAVGNKQKEKT